MKNLEGSFSIAQVKEFITDSDTKELPVVPSDTGSITLDILTSIDTGLTNFGMEIHYVVWLDNLYFTVKPINLISNVEDLAPENAVKLGKVYAFAGPVPASMDNRATGTILGQAEFDFAETANGFQIMLDIKMAGRPTYARVYDVEHNCISQMLIEDDVKVVPGTKLLINVKKFEFIDEESPAQSGLSSKL